MDLWMKVVWGLAAVISIACLVVLGRGAGSGGATISTSTGSGPVATPPGPEYFTKGDPARSTVEYGVREGGRAVIYNHGIMR